MATAKKLRIAFVLDDISRSGGMGRVVLEHAERLAQDHDVHFVCATLRDLRSSDVTVHHVALPSVRHAVRVPLFALRSSVAVRRREFDAVISQGPNCFAQTAMLMHFCTAECVRRMRSPSPVSLHPRPAARVVKRIWNAYCVAVERRLCRRLRGRVIAVSEGLARDIAASYGLERRDLHVVANGVDAREFSPENRATLGREFRAEHGLADAAFVALFVGGDWARKGLDHAIRALEFVGERDMHLVVVGDGDQQAFGDLIDAPARRRLHFIGSLRCCRAAYAAADAFVFPSYFEAFPLVVLEAAATGLPLVAAAVNGVEDILSDGETGLLIRREPEDIAAKLCQLQEDPALRQRMSRAAREAATRFSWDAAAERLGQCLSSMCSGRSGES